MIDREARAAICVVLWYLERIIDDVKVKRELRKLRSDLRKPLEEDHSDA